MEELIGRRVKIHLNSSHGFIIMSGEFLQFESPFILLSTTTGLIYINMYQVKTIELV